MLHYIRVFVVVNLLAISAKCSMADVQAAVKEHQLVPDIIATAPNERIQVTYSNGKQVNLGAELTPTEVKDEPKVEWNADPSTFYTLIMTDPDAPSRKEPTLREVNHWLVGNIKGRDISSGNVIRAYRGSGAPQGTGLHRYVFLVYKQPGQLQFDEDHVANNSRKDRLKFSTSTFTKKYNLGEPIAANFFQAQWDEYVPILQQLSTDN